MAIKGAARVPNGQYRHVRAFPLKVYEKRERVERDGEGAKTKRAGYKINIS